MELKDMPNLQAILQGCVSGHWTEWPAVRNELRELLYKLETSLDVLSERDDKEARLQDRIAELERKLAEYQATLEVCASLLSTDAGKLELKGREELNNLLAKAREEGRREAVPEDFSYVLEEAADVLEAVATMQYTPNLLRLPLVEELRSFSAMLSAAQDVNK